MTSSLGIHSQTDQVGQAQGFYVEGKQLHDNGDYDGAIASFQKAMRIQEPLLGKYHSHTIKTYWRIGRSSCMSPLNYHQGLVSFKRALRMAEGAYGRNDEKTLTMLGDIKDQLTKLSERESSNSLEETKSGTTAHSSCSYQDDLNAIAQALELEREGDTLSKLRKYKRAAEKYLEALRMEETTFGGGRLDCADIMSKVACMYRLRGDLEKSCDYFRKAHELYKSILGDDHPATLGAKANIQTILSASSSSQSSTLSSSSSFSFGKSSLFGLRNKKKMLRNNNDSQTRFSWLGALSTTFRQKHGHPQQIAV